MAAYVGDTNNYSPVAWRLQSNPYMSWAFPVVTGHKYKLHWAGGLDWTKMEFDLSEKWTPNDLDTIFAINFTDVRAQVNFTVNGQLMPNNSFFLNDSANHQFGANVVYNDTPTREMFFLINGKNSSKWGLQLTTARCVGPCLATVTSVVVENNTRLWSDAT